MRPHRILPLALLAAVACSDSTGPAGPRPPRGVVVLNASQSQGLTLVSADGAQSSFLGFDYPDYDGGAITLVNDTVLTTTSKGGGDQLLVADLVGGRVIRLQLPAGSNPAGVSRVPVTGAGYQYVVALRDSQAIALVGVPASGAAQDVTVTLLRDAGLCPVDVVARGASLWSLDANTTCRGSYEVQGAARLVRIAANVRDTIALPAAARGTAGSITVVGDTAYIATSGEADFSSWPDTRFTTPGMIVKFDLATKTVLAARTLPAGSYGAGLKRGADGRLYVTAYTATDFSTQDVFALDPTTLVFTGTLVPGASRLALVKADGGRPACVAATADAAGNVYCVEVDYAAAGASTVRVFDTAGTELRHMSAGQYAADLALR